jgi:2,6-dihydroxypseudooxynicotine hydrolase
MVKAKNAPSQVIQGRRPLSAKSLDELLETSRGRMLGDGLEALDLDEILDRCSGFEDWYEVVADIGDRYEKMADDYLSKCADISAGEMLWRASMYYHYAQFYMFERPDLREAGQKKKVEFYKRAAPLFFPPAERVEIPFEEFFIPGYLRLPRGIEKPPLVVLIGGLESTKEESFLFERLCLDRGMATYAFDGPGQGEMFFQTPMRGDFHRFTSAVIDYFETHRANMVDTSRIGLLGRSLGGYYAALSAAHEKRIKVCVCWGVLFDYESRWDQLDSFTKDGVTYCCGETDPDKAREKLRFIDLTGHPEKITCALFIQHGVKDSSVPIAHAKKLEAAAVNAPELVTQYEEGGIHCCHNLSHINRRPLADYLAKHLNAKP